MFVQEQGLPPDDARLRVVWGHGWGQSHDAFSKMVEPLAVHAHHVLLDFPGFGKSPLPPMPWGTAEYAAAVALWLRNHPFKGKTLWVGHSFGCRVGLRLAAEHSKLIQGLVVIAGAGLPRQRGLAEKVRLKSKVYVFKLMKWVWMALGKDVGPLRAHFGSADYRNAGALRDSFVKIVNEDQTGDARRVTCPTLLLYGAADTETPPDIGKRLNDLIPNSCLVVLEGQDHYSLLDGGRHQVLKHLNTMMKKLAE